ncbi:unnamed protein product [Ectocarpus sp. 8 AP-2014]
MVHLGNKKCMQRGCQLRPDHGNPGTKKPEFCSQHKKQGMVKVTDVVTAAPLAPDSTQSTEKRKMEPNPSERPVDLKRVKRNPESIELPGFSLSRDPPAVAPATGPLDLRAVAATPAVLTTFSSASGASSAAAVAAAAAAAALAAARGVAMSTGAVGGVETAGRARVLEAAPRGATGDTKSAMAFPFSPGSSGGSTGMTAGLRTAQHGGLGASWACQGSGEVSAVHNGGVVAGAVADYQGKHGGGGAPAAFRGQGAGRAANVAASHGVARGAVGATNLGNNSGFSALHGQAGGEAGGSASVFPQGASEMPVHGGAVRGGGEAGGAAAAIGVLPASQPPGGAGGKAMCPAAEGDVDGGVVVPHSTTVSV